MVNHGVNGGIARADCCVIEETSCCINVEGIDNHILADHPIITAGGVTNSNCGPIILILHKYALTGKGTTIHSSPQIEWNKVGMDDKSVKVGGSQCLLTLDGFTIPLNIHCGLPYLDMQPFSDTEWKELPHVVLTHKDDWDPTVLDNELSNDLEWHDSLPSPPLLHPLFDDHGDFGIGLKYTVML